MDTTSIVTSYPALADCEARLQGGPALAAQVRAGEGAMKVALSGASGNIGSLLRGG